MVWMKFGPRIAPSVERSWFFAGIGFDILPEFGPHVFDIPLTGRYLNGIAEKERSRWVKNLALNFLEEARNRNRERKKFSAEFFIQVIDIPSIF